MSCQKSLRMSKATRRDIIEKIYFMSFEEKVKAIFHAFPGRIEYINLLLDFIVKEQATDMRVSYNDGTSGAPNVRLEVFGVAIFELSEVSEITKDLTNGKILYECSLLPELDKGDYKPLSDEHGFPRPFRTKGLGRVEAQNICDAALPYLLSRGKSLKKLPLMINVFPEYVKKVLEYGCFKD